MKDYKLKYMTQDMIDEIDELWREGHGEAITAHVLECVNAWNEGRKRGFRRGVLNCLCAIGAGAIIGQLWHRYEKKRQEAKVIDVEVETEKAD